MDITPTIIKAIWTTEEYAIITFKSLTPQQTIARRPPPKSESTININTGLITLNMYPSRIRPYPPNFKRIPARTIDPLTGAST